MAIGAILGSAFAESTPSSWNLREVEVETRLGAVTLGRVDRFERRVYLLFRHGRPHSKLPNQIPYRRHALALDRVDCRALLVTSSVGVLRRELPLFEPLLVGDLLTLDNRLPDGRACTIFDEPSDRQGHLVLDDGLVSSGLTGQLRSAAQTAGYDPPDPVVFGYVGGPRGKTRAENQMWRSLGADVNSMTLAPEVILANELQIPCAGLVVGHKYSLPDQTSPEESVESTLEGSEEVFADVVPAFLDEAEPVPFPNELYRFDRE